MSATTAAGERPGGLSESAAIPAGQRLDRVRFAWGSLALLAPAAALLIVLFLYPVIYSFYLGFTNLSLTGPHAFNYGFTGLANVQKLLHDTVFHQSLYLTGIFVAASGVLGATGVGLLLAIAMQRAMAVTRVLIGAIVLICFMLPPATAALLWYTASVGGGTLTRMLGTPQSDFLHSVPMVLVSAANAWNITGLAMILFAAALRNISSEITESAKLENASAAQRFMRITLPLLRPTIVTTVLLMTLLSLANFTIVYIMTAGGPGSSTMILPVYSYLQAFQYNQLAYGALVGNMMVLLATGFSVLYVRFSRERA